MCKLYMALGVVFVVVNCSMIGYYFLAFKLFVGQEIIEVNVHLVSRTPEQDKYRNVQLVGRTHEPIT